MMYLLVSDRLIEVHPTIFFSLIYARLILVVVDVLRWFSRFPCALGHSNPTNFDSKIILNNDNVKIKQIIFVLWIFNENVIKMELFVRWMSVRAGHFSNVLFSFHEK